MKRGMLIHPWHAPIAGYFSLDAPTGPPDGTLAAYDFAMVFNAGEVMVLGALALVVDVVTTVCLQADVEDCWRGSDGQCLHFSSFCGSNVHVSKGK